MFKFFPVKKTSTFLSSLTRLLLFVLSYFKKFTFQSSGPTRNAARSSFLDVHRRCASCPSRIRSTNPADKQACRPVLLAYPGRQTY